MKNKTNCSISCKGNYWGNATLENFFSIYSNFKVKLLVGLSNIIIKIDDI